MKKIITVFVLSIFLSSCLVVDTKGKKLGKHDNGLHKGHHKGKGKGNK